MRIPPPTLPSPDPLCLIDADEQGNLPHQALPMPPERERCPQTPAAGQSIEAFNQEQAACIEQKDRDQLVADARAQKVLNQERNYRQACVRWIKGVQE